MSILITLHENGKNLQIPVIYTVEYQSESALIYKCRLGSDCEELRDIITTHEFDIKATHIGSDVIIRLVDTPIGNINTCFFIDEISDRVRELEILKMYGIDELVN